MGATNTTKDSALEQSLSNTNEHTHNSFADSVGSSNGKTFLCNAVHFSYFEIYS